MKPTGKDIFTIHTFYPNDDNAVVFKNIPPDDNSFIRLIVLNNSYKYDKFDNTYNEKSKLASNKTFTQTLI